MPANLLTVPHLTQGDDALCLPVCVAMVLAYYQSPVIVQKLAQLFDTTEFGTPFYVNDPLYDDAPQVCSLDGFIAAWIEQQEIAIFIENNR